LKLRTLKNKEREEIHNLEKLKNLQI